MIKIEQLKNGAKATIIRNDVAQPVYVGMNVTNDELASLEIELGSVVYTIDETEIVEVSAGVNAPQAPVDTKSQEQSATAVETSVEAEAPVVKPAIVKPAPRSAKK
jgi:hypothetical protein